jgi:hypothetical protein
MAELGRSRILRTMSREDFWREGEDVPLVGREVGGEGLCVDEVVDEDDLGSVFVRVRGSVLARVSPGVGSGGLEVGGFSEASLGVDDGEEDLRKCWERWWVVCERRIPIVMVVQSVWT